MNEKILIIIAVEMPLLVLLSFALFSAFHYCKDDRPEKVFMIVLGVFCAAMMVVTGIGIMTS